MDMGPDGTYDNAYDLVLTNLVGSDLEQGQCRRWAPGLVGTVGHLLDLSIIGHPLQRDGFRAQ